MPDSTNMQIGKHEISMAGFHIKEITFGRPFGTSAPPDDAPAIWANIHVPSVGGAHPAPPYGMWVHVSWTEKLDHYPDDPRVLGELVRAAVLKALEHEVDERLYVNGVRLRDPHPEKRDA